MGCVAAWRDRRCSCARRAIARCASASGSRSVCSSLSRPGRARCTGTTRTARSRPETGQLLVASSFYNNLHALPLCPLTPRLGRLQTNQFSTKKTVDHDRVISGYMNLLIQNSLPSSDFAFICILSL